MTPPLLHAAAPTRACRRGHPIDTPDARTPSGDCRACKRKRDRVADEKRRAANRTTKLDDGPSTTTHPNWERMDSELLVTEPVEGQLVVTRPDGVECYRIDEWFRRFGRPPIAYTILENDQ